VDLAYLRIMERLRDAVAAPAAVNWVSAALQDAVTGFAGRGGDGRTSGGPG
jgi:hypothetical protein